MRAAQITLAASALLLGAVATARAQTPADSGRREETLRSHGWMYMPRYEYRFPRMRLDLDHMRMDALDRAERVRERQFALRDRLLDRRFDLERRLRDRQFDRQDRMWRRQMELHDRLMDRMHERMDRLHEMRPFMMRHRYRMI